MGACRAVYHPDPEISAAVAQEALEACLGCGYVGTGGVMVLEDGGAVRAKVDVTLQCDGARLHYLVHGKQSCPVSWCFCYPGGDAS